MANENISLNVKLLHGPVANYNPARTSDDAGKLFFATEADSRSYLYLDNGTSRFNIVPKLLTVVNGGTGLTSLESGKALIGNGTGNVNFRSITNNTDAAPVAITKNDNLITANTLGNWNGAYANTSSNIKYVGILQGGTWQASTIAVSYGGTGATTFTTNGVLYGNAISPIGATAAGSNGDLLGVDSNGIPAFTTPQLVWSYSDADGKSIATISFKVNGVSYDAPAPNASITEAGLVNTIAQSFKGVKTFTDTIISSTVRPSDNSSYTSGTSAYPWKSVFGTSIKLVDTAGYEGGSFNISTPGTTSAQGITTLYIGNDKTEKTEGGTKGELYIYNTTAYATKIVSAASSSTKTLTIPNYSGYAVVGISSDSNVTTETEYRLPFYYTKFQRLGTNDGFSLKTLQGVANTSGTATLILGNSIDKATAGNKRGGIRLYSEQKASFLILPNTGVTSTEETEYTIMLPKVDGTNNLGEFLFHDVGTSIGTASRPVYIQANGKPSEVTTMAVSYGGTGQNTFTSKAVLYGNGTGGLQTTNVGSQGQILSPDANKVPSFATPSFSWPNNNTTNKQPFLRMTLQGKTWDSPIIPLASTSQSGVVTIADQSFKGLKTFTTGVKVSASTTSSDTTTGALVVTGGTGIGGALHVGSNAVISGDMHVYGGNFYLGTSNAATSRIQMTYTAGSSGDTLTITFND